MADSSVNSSAAVPPGGCGAAGRGEGRTTWDQTGDATPTATATTRNAGMNLWPTSLQLGMRGRAASSIDELTLHTCQVLIDFRAATSYCHLVAATEPFYGDLGARVREWRVR